MIYDLSQIKNVYLVGDIHGDFETFKNQIFARMSVNYARKANKLAEELQEELERERREETNERDEIIDGPRLRWRGLNFGDAHIHAETPDIPQEDVDDGPFSLTSLENERLTKKKNVKVKTSMPYDECVFIVCGDCGLGFNKLNYYLQNFEEMNALLAQVNTHIFFVRGNHDDPSYFNGEVINFSNIKAIEDYSVVKTANFTTLCVGGAVSVDRMWRKQQEIRLNRFTHSNPKKLFWEGEEPIYDANKIDEILASDLKIDSVATHTCPSFCPPMDKDTSLTWLRIDKTLKDDVSTERLVMDKIFEHLQSKKSKIKFWCYGHFHNSYTFEKDKTFFFGLTTQQFLDPFLQLKISEEKKKISKKKVKFSSFSSTLGTTFTTVPTMSHEEMEAILARIRPLTEERNLENNDNNADRGVEEMGANEFAIGQLAHPAHLVNHGIEEPLELNNQIENEDWDFADLDEANAEENVNPRINGYVANDLAETVRMYDELNRFARVGGRIEETEPNINMRINENNGRNDEGHYARVNADGLIAPF